MATGETDQALVHPRAASLAAEQHYLGSVLVDPAAWELAGAVASADLSNSRHQLIHGAMEELDAAGQPLDTFVVAEQLKRKGHLEAAGNIAYLSELARETPTAANVRAYADIVREYAARRRLAELLEEEPTGPELTRQLERELERLRQGAPARAAPRLATEPVSDWAERPEPAPRDWVLAGLIPGARVTSFLGTGGLGKTTISASIAVHVASGRRLWNLAVTGGPVLGIFCEDEREEIERRVRAACAAEQLELAELPQLHIAARDGQENLLCTFEREQIQLTDFYRQTEAAIAALAPRLVIVDTAADVFAGDFMSTPQVRQFIKFALGGLCVRYGCAILLVAHPSKAGANSGDGDGFSTAWHNSVRSRLYLRRPPGDPDATRDRRVLEVKKANYAADGVAIPLLWQHGCFVPDPEPLEQAARAERTPRTETRLAMATMDVFRDKGASGQVLTLGIICDHLREGGALPDGKEETVRKRVSRALKDLEADGLITSTKVPRGYRLVMEARDGS